MVESHENKINVWLDDDRDPNKPNIQKKYGSFPGMVWVKTAKDAIDLLKTGTVEYISLDHDLGDENIVGNGYQVAKWIEEKAFFKDELPEKLAESLSKLKWKVHSQNGVGARKMLMALSNADRYLLKSTNE